MKMVQKSSKRIANIVEKGAILLFLQCFQKTRKNKGLFGKRVNPLPDDKILDWSNLKQIADDIFECIWNGK